MPNQFRLDGYLPAGSATPSGSQIVNLTAGGYCGSIGTADGSLRLTLRPSTCAKVREQNPAAPDGTYVLSLVHGTRDVEVYCHDMAGTPREFLTLPKTGSTTNYALYGQSPNTSAGGLKSWYTKARFDPATLTLALGDTTFATSEGWARYGSTYVYSQGLGNAADCAAPHSQTGRGNIDLTGTPFDIVPNQFRLDGYLPAGSATPSGSQIVHLAAGGYCGSIGTADGSLQLTLRPAL
ncbi:GON domain-containing protein [Cystobacter fuscus]